MSYHSRQPSIASSLLSSTTFNTGTNINKIGPWKLGKTLGQGSTGRVLLAEHQSTGQKAAVKVVSKSALNSMDTAHEDRGRDAAGLAYGIEREIIIMKLLNHPNVLRLYDVWETSKSLYLILEYVEGGELFDLLVEKGPLPEVNAVKFFRQIILGTSYCHALGICHRDLKPENLLLDADLNVKLADFGMAALENNERLLETSCGSPHYAAPEIVSGKSYHGFESDVWSCGVILFALLTGRLPFDDENIRNLLLKVQNGSFEMPMELSIEAKDLISQMLQVDTKKRIKTHDILSHPLLLKYKIDQKDQEVLDDLPSPNSYMNNIHSESEIDEQILSNLITLYHGRSKQQIIENLLVKESTTEKIFYFLLLRYRHNQSNSSLMRSFSIAKSINNNKSQSFSTTTSTSTPKKNRRSVISVSSSHRKSVSFQRSPYKSPRRSLIESGTQQPPVPRNLFDDFKQQQASNSPSPKKGTTRSSSRLSLVGGVSKTNNRKSLRQSYLGGNKRNSISTKLISLYSQLAKDNEENFINHEAKRTSLDFATLCDDIFDYEEREKVRKEELKRLREEQLAKEKEQREKELEEQQERERQERIQLEEERKHKKELEIVQKKAELAKLMDEMNNSDMNNSDMTDEVAATVAEIQREQEEFDNLTSKLQNSKIRSTSNPTETSEKSTDFLDSLEISKIKQRAITNPVRPKSRLDPGLNFSDSTSSDPKVAYEANDIVTEAIRRSRFLGSKFDLSLKRQSVNLSKQRVSRNFNDERRTSRIVSAGVDEAADDAYNGPKTLADVKIPQVTRKSRLYSNSNKRLSVLSIYSTRESFTDLSAKLNGREDEFKQHKQSRLSQMHAPISMIPEEEGPISQNGLRLSYADRLTAINTNPSSDLQVEDADSGNTAEVGVNPIVTELGDDSNKNIELPELPDHLNVPKRNHSQRKPVSIHQDSSKPRPVSKVEDDESKVLPKHPKDDSVKQNNSVSTTKVTKTAPLNDSTNKRTASGNSFFRKWSTSSTGSNEHHEKQSSFFRMFSSSGVLEGKTLNTVYEPVEMYQTLKRLLISWNAYGLKNIESSDKDLTIEGDISKANIFGLNSTKFKLEISKFGKKGSSIKFLKTKGSKKGFKMLENEIERILSRENVLAFVN